MDVGKVDDVTSQAWTEYLLPQAASNSEFIVNAN